MKIPFRGSAGVQAGTRLDLRINAVVRADTCSGCGGCTHLDPSLRMQLDEHGFLRPVRGVGHAKPVANAVALFDSMCPGRRVDAPRPPGSVRHPILGPVVQAWSAWASDDRIRYDGSSGGTLTALAAWLTDTGQATRVNAAAMDPLSPTRTTPSAISDRRTALLAAGSRYAPVATLSASSILEPGTALIGKPCEASAARSLISLRDSGDQPLVMSFFCAGTPSQDATDRLITDLGMPDVRRITELRYRGRGWPGHFTAQDDSGREVSTTYERSWGSHLGRATQWRCKICPDGVGESADITAADFWVADARGYPVFNESAGTSALIARTERGAEVVRRAIRAGVLVAEPLDLNALRSVQPLQVSRRSTLLGRVWGSRFAGRPVPKYRGFGLSRLAAFQPRQVIRVGRGSFRRVRASAAQKPPVSG